MRKPVLLTDHSSASKQAIEILRSKKITFVEYDVTKFEESCCGELPTTVAPSVFAPEGVFKGLEGVRQYAAFEKSGISREPSETAYW